MKRTIYFTGEMKEEFGESMVLYCDNLRDVIKGIEANRPGFRAYLVSLAERQLDIRIYHAGKYIKKDSSSLYPLSEEDIILSVAPTGAFISAIIAGIAAIVAAPAAIGAAVGGIVGGAIAFAGQALLFMGFNKILNGIIGMLAPDPVEGENPDDTYLFSGPRNRFSSGTPLPIVYGEVRMSGLPINIQIVSAPFDGAETEIDSKGNIFAHRI